MITCVTTPASSYRKVESHLHWKQCLNREEKFSSKQTIEADTARLGTMKSVGHLHPTQLGTYQHLATVPCFRPHGKEAAKPNLFISRSSLSLNHKRLLLWGAYFTTFKLRAVHPEHWDKSARYILGFFSPWSSCSQKVWSFIGLGLMFSLGDRRLKSRWELLMSFLCNASDQECFRHQKVQTASSRFLT